MKKFSPIPNDPKDNCRECGCAHNYYDYGNGQKNRTHYVLLKEAVPTSPWSSGWGEIQQTSRISMCPCKEWVPSDNLEYMQWRYENGK